VAESASPHGLVASAAPVLAGSSFGNEVEPSGVTGRLTGSTIEEVVEDDLSWRCLENLSLNGSRNCLELSRSWCIASFFDEYV
jgi:hypothetical protein